MNDAVGTATPEDVVLGCLLDKADVTYPLTLAEYIVERLRDAGMLQQQPPADD